MRTLSSCARYLSTVANETVAIVGGSRSAAHASLCLREGWFELFGAAAVNLRDRFSDGVGQRCVDGVCLSTVVDRYDADRAGG
jgi:hypothetical protein